MSGQVLFEHQHRGELWRLEVVTHNGRTFGNWRKWYRAEGDWRPTKQGCTLPLEALREITAELMAFHGLEPPAAPAPGR